MKKWILRVFCLMLMVMLCGTTQGAAANTEYHLYYKLEGGTGVPDRETGYYQTMTINPKTPKKFGFLFAGWSDGENTYQPGDKYRITSVLNEGILYAQWEPAPYHTVSFVAEGAEEVPEDIVFYENEEYVNIVVWNLSREGYRFQGYATEPDGPVVYDNPGSYSTYRYREHKDLTLYAQWRRTNPCYQCGGDGKVDGNCKNCGGDGKTEYKITCVSCDGAGEIFTAWHVKCGVCGGKGYFYDSESRKNVDCRECMGDGKNHMSGYVDCKECSGGKKTVYRQCSSCEDGIASETADCGLCRGMGDLEVCENVHTYGQWTEKQPAAYLSGGVRERLCLLCGQVEQEEIARLEHSFKDVKPGTFYYEPVLWALDHAVTKGVDDSHFGPDAGCSRGHVVTFLWRCAGSPAPASEDNPFTDVEKGRFCYEAVLWAVEKGITNGISATEFAPDKTCTRGQVVTFLWRYAGQPRPDCADASFSDVKQNAYYTDAVAWAVENQITKGVGDGKFAPEDTCTRGQVVTFLYRTEEHETLF